MNKLVITGITRDNGKQAEQRLLQEDFKSLLFELENSSSTSEGVMNATTGFCIRCSCVIRGSKNSSPSILKGAKWESY
ncbi:hypothetical protein NPIL_250191 [Nephila pilipes]|uniref:Uncharacterized protein n=1 Tax=Nephila pilipes TaxID=299642 RepID=A0A8X6NHT8_NEPPI|nr:hypothetical protein NPIL_250191 [Nephila pilipes]